MNLLPVRHGAFDMISATHICVSMWIIGIHVKFSFKIHILGDNVYMFIRIHADASVCTLQYEMLFPSLIIKVKLSYLCFMGAYLNVFFLIHNCLLIGWI